MFLDVDYSLKPQNIKLSMSKPDINRSVIATMSEAYNVQRQAKFSNVSQLSFSLPVYVYDADMNWVRNPNVDIIRERFYVKAESENGTEWYIINKVTNSYNDNEDVKNIECFGIEYELANQTIRVFNPDRSVTAYEALSYFLNNTNWTVGYVDKSLLSVYRSFNDSSKTILDSILGLADTYKCLVFFDRVNRTVSLDINENIGKDSGLVLSENKFLKTMDYEINTDEFCTRLKVYGQNGISINEVSPTGGDYIENYHYFMYPFEMDSTGKVIQSSYYMSDDLCIALTNYETLINQNLGQFTYLVERSTALSNLKDTKTLELDNLKTSLSQLQTNLLKAQLTGDPYNQIQDKITQTNNQITAKQNEINYIISEINSISSQQATLRYNLSKEKNFTGQQLIELNQYIIEKEWSDSSYIDPNDLYSYALKYFYIINKPQINIKISVVDFLQVVESQKDWSNLTLGDFITIKYSKFNIDVKARLIEIDHNYESGDITLTISNFINPVDDKYKLAKLLQTSINTQASVDLNKYSWDRIKDTSQQVSDITSNPWDAGKNPVTNGNVTFDSQGIKVVDPNNPSQWLILSHGSVSITKDNGQTFDNALNTQGLTAEQITGKLIVGQELQISNQNGTVDITGNGINIGQGTIAGYDASTVANNAANALQSGIEYNGVQINTTDGLVVTKSDDTVKTTVNATDGIKIQKNVNGTWTDEFYADTNGVVHLAGIVDANGQVNDRTAFTVGTSLDGFGSGVDSVFNSTGNVTLPVAQPDVSSVIKQYSSFTLNAGHTLTVSDRCRGLFIYVQGDCVINGTIDMSGKSAKVSKSNSTQRILQIPVGTMTIDCPVGGNSGQGGNGGNGIDGNGGTPTGSPSDVGDNTIGFGGQGAPATQGLWFGGAMSSPGAAGGGGYTPNSLPASKCNGGSAGSTDYDSAIGQGGTNGYAGSNGGNFCGGGASSLGMSGYGGGINNGQAYDGTYAPSNTGFGGGLLCLIVKGNLTINGTGVINCNGTPGANGGNGGTCANNIGAGAGGGGASGSGGGICVIAHRGTYANNGSITVNSGGTGIGGMGGSVGTHYAPNGQSGTPGTVGSIVIAQV